MQIKPVKEKENSHKLKRKSTEQMKLPTGTDNLPKIAKRGEVTPIKKLIFSKITLQIQNRNPV